MKALRGISNAATPLATHAPIHKIEILSMSIFTDVLPKRGLPMFNRQSIHIALLMWGCIFCLIAALCMYLSRDVDRSKKKLMLYMQFSCAVLLGSDAAAWAFRGEPGSFGRNMVYCNDSKRI